MSKVKDVIRKKGQQKKTNIKVKDLIGKVRENLHKRRVEKAEKMLGEKYKQLEEAEQVVRKITGQINIIKDMDIADIELEDYEY